MLPSSSSSSSLSLADRLLAVLLRDDDREEEPRPSLPGRGRPVDDGFVWVVLVAGVVDRVCEDWEDEGSSSNSRVNAFSISPRHCVRTALMVS